jgi:ubiquinone/menaquinone biosynthesis C-methylase UbiE
MSVEADPSSARRGHRQASDGAASARLIREFWEAHPVAAAAIPHAPGTPDYFREYDRLREANESVEFSYRLHEYRHFAGRRVLDVGCGNGYVLSRYAAEGAEAHGVDVTRTGIRLCRQRFALGRLPGRFVVGSAEELPYADGTFDCVCSMGVIHHIPDAGRAVGEFYRVLKPGGRLIIMVYHRNSAYYRLSMALSRLRTGKSLQQLVRGVDGQDSQNRADGSRRVVARDGTMVRVVSLCQGLEAARRMTKGRTR